MSACHSATTRLVVTKGGRLWDCRAALMFA